MSYDKDSLILSHLDLARDIANREWRTATHVLRRDDMLSLAYLGLVDAADRWIPYCEKNEFDPAATQYFRVFAGLRIRGTIRDHIRKEDWATRTLRSKSKKLKEAGQDEGLTIQELSEKTGFSVAEIDKINARLAARPVSLESITTNTQDKYADSNPTPSNELRDKDDTEGTAFSNDILSVFANTVKTMPKDIQLVIVLHYYSKLDLRRVAEVLGLSESKISQLHTTGVLSVKDALTHAATEGI